MTIGISYDVFWHLSPTKLKPFVTAYNNRKRELDHEHWMQGQYNLQAFRVVMDEAICGFAGKGKKPKTKYYDKPVLWKFLDEEELTEEEKEKKALEKEILAMEQWIANDKAKGLKETKLK